MNRKIRLMTSEEFKERGDYMDAYQTGVSYNGIFVRSHYHGLEVRASLLIDYQPQNKLNMEK